MNRMHVLCGAGVALLVSGMSITGCSKKLLRENVLAHTGTVTGLSVAQNPQTQVYELKLGYARHELFIVPTSKRVTYVDGEQEAAGKAGLVKRTTTTNGTTTTEEPVVLQTDYNDPTGTPEVLGEIQVGGLGKQSLQSQDVSVKLYQRLAVGREAVKSNAAVALMAQDPETAKALAASPFDATGDNRDFNTVLAILDGVESILSSNAETDEKFAEIARRLDGLAQSVGAIEYMDYLYEPAPAGRAPGADGRGALGKTTRSKETLTPTTFSSLLSTVKTVADAEDNIESYVNSASVQRQFRLVDGVDGKAPARLLNGQEAARREEDLAMTSKKLEYLQTLLRTSPAVKQAIDTFAAQF